MTTSVRQLAFAIEGLPFDLQPMRAKVAREPFDSPRWLFEAKWGGPRALAFVGGGRVSIRLGKGHEVSENLADVAQGITDALSMDGVVLDGELVARDRWGKASASMVFDRLAGDRRIAVAFHVSDILYHGYRPLLQQPLVRRKAVLNETLQASELVVKTYAQDSAGRVFFDAASVLGMEGIYAKRKNSAYYPGQRSAQWLKILERRTANLVVGGYTLARGRKQTFERLLLGAYHGDELRFLGTVAGRFPNTLRSKLTRDLSNVHTQTCPFDATPPVGQLLYWCRPRLTMEVEYGEQSPDGRLRFPVFSALRPDLDARDCTLDATGLEVAAAPSRRR